MLNAGIERPGIECVCAALVTLVTAEAVDESLAEEANVPVPTERELVVDPVVPVPVVPVPVLPVPVVPVPVVPVAVVMTEEAAAEAARKEALKVKHTGSTSVGAGQSAMGIKFAQSPAFASGAASRGTAQLARSDKGTKLTNMNIA